ncbi:MAG: alginate lyase family protein [Bacteroidota bacterium]
MKIFLHCVLIFLLSFQTIFGQISNRKIRAKIIPILKAKTLENAEWAMNQLPITVTNEQCERSAGGMHDFYSEGDYWWQNPDDPNGPYIQKDGLSNPNNFVAHRKAMVRLSIIIGSLASAYVITKDEKFVKKAFEHLNAWFIDEATLMNPSLNFAQAIKGRATGRGIGIIDMIQMIEVAQGIIIMQNSKSIDPSNLGKIKNWFSNYLLWVTTHKYGIEEREAKNNHGTCWVMQVAVFSKLVDNQALIDYCVNRFKTVLIPNQMAKDGSFPLELARTKPYGYALFNLDAMATICHVLSKSGENLWNYAGSNGQTIKTGIEYMYPFIADKPKWNLPKDVMYWEEWPVAQPSLLFGYKQYKDYNWFKTWSKLNHFPTTEEVIRNLPIRHPLIWLI